MELTTNTVKRKKESQKHLKCKKPVTKVCTHTIELHFHEVLEQTKDSVFIAISNDRLFFRGHHLMREGHEEYFTGVHILTGYVFYKCKHLLKLIKLFKMQSLYISPYMNYTSINTQ